MINLFDRLFLNKAVRAYTAPNDPPLIGDMRPTVDFPAGTKFSEITQFEVWTGDRWASPEEIYKVQK